MAATKKTTTTAKKTASATAKKTTTKKAVEKETTIETKNTEISALKEAIEKQNEAITQLQKPQVIVTQADTERVHFLWIANVADDNIMDFGAGGMYGRIVGKTGTFFVPKNELSRILDTTNRYFMDKRNLIVVSGLTEEERESLGVNYKEKELLDVKTFQKIAELPKEDVIAIYADLCETHKDMLAQRLHEAFMNRKAVNREMVVEMNKIHSNIALKDIIEKMNEKDAG